MRSSFLTSSPSAVVPEDSESNLNALLSQLGPAETVNEREIKGAKVPPGEAVGGLVNCLLIQADKDGGRQELRGGSVRGALLQRIASRCHCNVIYVSYGGQAETDAGKISHAINSVSHLVHVLCNAALPLDRMSMGMYLLPSLIHLSPSPSPSPPLFPALSLSLSLSFSLSLSPSLSLSA